MDNNSHNNPHHGHSNHHDHNQNNNLNPKHNDLNLNAINSKPKGKFGFQEIVILVLIIFIVLLAVIAAIIFLKISPFSSSNNSTSSSKTTSMSSTVSTTKSSASSSSMSSASSMVATSKTSTTLSTSSSSSTASVTSSKTSTTSSSSSSASSNSSSVSSSTTSVAGNLKVYFQKGETVDVVGRDSTATTTYQKTIDAVLAKVKGPTASEISAGYKADLNLSGDSNCAGNWFELDTSGGKATLKFCRTVTLTGAVADGLLEQSLGKTLMDNSGLSKAVILNKDNNCLFNASGLNSCKN